MNPFNMNFLSATLKFHSAIQIAEFLTNLSAFLPYLMISWMIPCIKYLISCHCQDFSIPCFHTWSADIVKICWYLSSILDKLIDTLLPYLSSWLIPCFHTLSADCYLAPILDQLITPTTPWQNLPPVETHPRPTEAIPEMVFNQSKNFLTLNFQRKKHFLNLNSIQKKL